MARKVSKIIIRNIESKIKILEKKSGPKKIVLEESIEIPEEKLEKKSSFKPLQSLEDLDQSPQVGVQEKDNSRKKDERSTHYDQLNSRKPAEYTVDGVREKYDSTEPSQKSLRQLKRSRGLFDSRDENKRNGLHSIDEHEGDKYESSRVAYEPMDNKARRR